MAAAAPPESFAPPTSETWYELHDVMS